jgi:hypothetical protein
MPDAVSLLDARHDETLSQRAATVCIWQNVCASILSWLVCSAEAGVHVCGAVKVLRRWAAADRTRWQRINSIDCFFTGFTVLHSDAASSFRIAGQVGLQRKVNMDCASFR